VPEFDVASIDDLAEMLPVKSVSAAVSPTNE
jgi:hypothetical protein